MRAATVGVVRLCEHCAESLVRRHRENSQQWRKRRYCSRTCFARALAARCDAVDVSAIYANYELDFESGCWNWQGHMDSNGYGRAFDITRPRGKRSEWAHRVFYRRFKGEIPARHEVDHVCQNTRCVNPSHLEAVTKVEHARRTFERLGLDDKHRLAAELRTVGLTYAEISQALEYAHRDSASLAVKAAIKKGLVDPNALPQPLRLTDAERDDIRALHAVGVPQPELAAWYGVDSAHISRICNRLDARSRSAAEGGGDA